MWYVGRSARSDVLGRRDCTASARELVQGIGAVKAHNDQGHSESHRWSAGRGGACRGATGCPSSELPLWSFQRQRLVVLFFRLISPSNLLSLSSSSSPLGSCVNFNRLPAEFNRLPAEPVSTLAVGTFSRCIHCYLSLPDTVLSACGISSGLRS
jgi:hypothetical protein